MDNLLRNNKVVLLIALVLSLLLWFSVRGTPDTSSGIFSPPTDVSQLSVQADVINVPDTVTVVNPHPLASLTLRGDRVALLQITYFTSSLHCTVDVQGLPAGTYTSLPVHVTGLPANVIAEGTAQVQLLQNVSKTMNVELTPQGSLADGFTVGSIKIDPVQVTLKGPDSDLSGVRKVTAVLPLQKSDTGTISRTLQIHAVNDLGQPIDRVQVSPQTISVTVQVIKPTQTLPIKVQLIGDAKAGFVIDSVSSSPQTVEVLGDVSNLDSYPIPALDVTGIAADKSYPVKLQSIPGITQVTPSSITVTVHVAAAQKKTFGALPIQTTGVPAGYTATLQVQKADLTVEGSKAVVDAIQPADVGLSVDVSTVLPGTSGSTYNLPIQIKAPKGVRTQLSVAQTVTVTLNKT